MRHSPGPPNLHISTCIDSPMLSLSLSYIHVHAVLAQTGQIQTMDYFNLFVLPPGAHLAGSCRT
jgi:hypothetical protein